MTSKTYLPQWNCKPHGPLYHALWKVFDEDNYKLLSDPISKKPQIFQSSIDAMKAAKAFVVSLQPEIRSLKKEDAPVEDILGIGAFFAEKATERAQNNIRRKNKKMKPVEVEVKGRSRWSKKR